MDNAREDTLNTKQHLLKIWVPFQDLAIGGSKYSTHQGINRSIGAAIQL